VGGGVGELLQAGVGLHQLFHGPVEGLLGQTLLGDIPGDNRVTDQFVSIVVDGVDDHMGPETLPILAEPPSLPLEMPPVAGGIQRVLGQTGVYILRDMKTRQMLADDLLGAVALEALRAGVPTGDPPRQIQHEDGVISDPFHQQPEAPFALPQAFLGTSMFLDFGTDFLVDTNPNYYNHDLYPQGLWDEHEIILIKNFNEQFVRSFVAPANSSQPNPTTLAGRVVWDDCEWSNHPYFATAALDVNRISPLPDKYEAIYLINAKDSSYLRLIEMNNATSDSVYLQWPWVYIEKPANFVEEAGWLDYHTKNPVRRDITIPGARGLSLTLENRTLSSNRILESVGIFNLLGTRLKSIDPQENARSVELPAMPAGTYFVQVATPQHKSGVFKWSVSR